MDEEFQSGVALSALSDPSSMATEVQGDTPKAETLLSLQIKLHLLTSQHLLLSKGFLFDNPGLWPLIRSAEFVNGLQKLGSARGSTLIIQTADHLRKDISGEDIDLHFRHWAFGTDQRSIMVPSARRIATPSARRNRADFRRLRQNPSATLDEYGLEMDFKALRDAVPNMRSLFQSCNMAGEPEDRYSTFTNSVRTLVSRVSAAREASPGPFESLYDSVDRVAAFLGQQPTLSRSSFEAWDEKLWWLWAPYVNHYRLMAHCPPEMRNINISLLPSRGVRGSSALQSLLPKLPEKTLTRPAWSVALENLSFETIFTIREQSSFQDALHRLAEAQGETVEVHRRAQIEILQNVWAPEILHWVDKLAPTCIVKKTAVSPAWATPALQAGAVSGIAALGGAAGLHTLIGVGSAATWAMATAAVAGGGASIAGLGVIAAVTIANLWRVDTPAKAAQLIVDTVLRDASDSQTVL